MLLRGVNVGGANRLAMADLRATIGALGVERVATYIQSGNVVVDGWGDHDELDVVAAVGTALRDRYGLAVPVVARRAAEFAAVADRHPDLGTGIDPRFLHVAFLDRAPDPAVISTVAADRFAPDAWRLDRRELFLTYPDGSGRSPMTIDRFERAWDVAATARNLTTVRRIASMAGV